MQFTVEGRWRGRDVSVTWEDGELSGDAELVASLRQLDGSGEIIGFTPESQASGRLVLRPSECLEARLSSRELALDTICYWIGDITGVSGDLDWNRPRQLHRVAPRCRSAAGPASRRAHSASSTSTAPITCSCSPSLLWSRLQVGPIVEARAHMGTGGFAVLRENPRMPRMARVLLAGLLFVGGCSDNSSDDAAPTTSATDASTESTASADATTSAPPREAQPGRPCAQVAIAGDLDVPVDHVRGEPECVDGFALVVVCAQEDENCPEGYTVLATVDGRWARIGHTLQTCTEGLVAQGVTPEAARQFEGYDDCFPDE
jgi:hypothetical protein